MVYLTDKNIKAFQQIHKTKFSEDISDKEARKKGVQLIRLMQLVYKPIEKNNLNK